MKKALVSLIDAFIVAYFSYDCKRFSGDFATDFYVNFKNPIALKYGGEDSQKMIEDAAEKSCRTIRWRDLTARIKHRYKIPLQRRTNPTAVKHCTALKMMA